MESRETVLDRVKRGRFLIGDSWVEPAGRTMFDIVTPSDESVFATVPCAAAEDIDAAVAAARRAFDTGPWPRLSHVERAGYLARIADAMEANRDLFSTIWTHEVGGLVGHADYMVTVSAGIVRDYVRLAS